MAGKPWLTRGKALFCSLYAAACSRLGNAFNAAFERPELRAALVRCAHLLPRSGSNRAVLTRCYRLRPLCHGPCGKPEKEKARPIAGLWCSWFELSPLVNGVSLRGIVFQSARTNSGWPVQLSLALSRCCGSKNQVSNRFCRAVAANLPRTVSAGIKANYRCSTSTAPSCWVYLITAVRLWRQLIALPSLRRC